MRAYFIQQEQEGRAITAEMHMLGPARAASALLFAGTVLVSLAPTAFAYLLPRIFVVLDASGDFTLLWIYHFKAAAKAPPCLLRRWGAALAQHMVRLLPSAVCKSIVFHGEAQHRQQYFFRISVIVAN